jgi:hypothetical protein
MRRICREARYSERRRGQCRTGTLQRRVSPRYDKSRSDADLRRQVVAKKLHQMSLVEAAEFGVMVRQPAEILGFGSETTQRSLKQSVQIECRSCDHMWPLMRSGEAVPSLGFDEQSPFAKPGLASVAVLVGVAPFARDSGLMKPRHLGGAAGQLIEPGEVRMYRRGAGGQHEGHKIERRGGARSIPPTFAKSVWHLASFSPER